MTTADDDDDVLHYFYVFAWPVMSVFFCNSIGFFLIGRFSPYEWSRVAQDKDVRRARYSFGLRGSLLFVLSTFSLQG